MYVNPIPRLAQEDIAKYDGLLARYHCAFPLAGDGSGGQFLWNFYFDTASGALFGGHTLMDIACYAINWTGVLAGAYSSITFVSYERTASANEFDLTWSAQHASNYGSIGGSDQFLPKFKWRLNEAGLSQFNLVLGPNLATATAVASVAGYLYDERFIRAN